METLIMNLVLPDIETHACQLLAGGIEQMWSQEGFEGKLIKISLTIRTKDFLKV